MPIVKITKRKLNEAIVDLISLHGYDACSMQMIAEKLGVTKASLYHYGNKEGVVLNAMKEYDDDSFKHFYFALKIYMSAQNHKNKELLVLSRKVIRLYAHLTVSEVIHKFRETIINQHKQ